MKQTDGEEVTAATAEAAAAKPLWEQLFEVGNAARLRALAWGICAGGRRVETELAALPLLLALVYAFVRTC